MKSLRLKAHAKVNLFLKVGQKRKDGYHSLRTLFQEISLYDILEFRVLKNPSIRLRVSGRPVSAGKDNLVVRALYSLRDRLGLQDGMEVRLRKNIPLGAGLGGGSSDAAAALWGGWLLWKKISISNYRKRVPALLVRCAKKLGADVPFFLKGGRALGKGIGEKLSSLSSSSHQWMVLVYPRVHVSTALAYRLVDRMPQKAEIQRKFFNSFEPAVFKRFPRIRIVSDELKKAGCDVVLMSGSGSSVFGLVKNKSEAIRIKRVLSRKPWDVFVVDTVL